MVKIRRAFLLPFAACLLLVFAPLWAEKGEIPTKEEGVVRFMTYNILEGGRALNRPWIHWKKGHGLSHEDRIPLIREVIQQVNPDVVFLQECNAWHENDAGKLSAFAKSVDMEGFVTSNHSPYKVALLSRLPILHHEWLEDEDPFAHNILLARLQLPGGKELQTASLHFGWWGHPDWDKAAPKERPALYDEQVQSLLGFLERHASIPLVMGGDFNHAHDQSIFQRPALYDRILELDYADLYGHLHGYDGSVRSVPPPKVIDYLFVSPPLKGHMTRCQILSAPSTYAASDHLPVWADLRVNF